MARTLFRAKRGKQPPASADKEFANEEGKVRQGTVRSFLPSRCNRRGILVHPRRIEGFADRKDDQIQRRHDVIRVNASLHSKVSVPEPLTEYTARSRHEPFCWQRHNEYSSGANNSAYHYHSIS